MVPSRKRTCVGRPKASSVEKLTKDLCTILHEQRSSHFSVSSEEDLLFESDTPMVSVEIGHGSILIRHPSSIAREEESEASSLSVENKRHPPNEAYSHLAALPVDIYKRKGTNFSSLGIEKCKKHNGQGLQHMQIKRYCLSSKLTMNKSNSPSDMKLMVLIFRVGGLNQGSPFCFS